MFNTVERRRIALLTVVALVFLHMFFSGVFINAQAIDNPDIRNALQGLYDEYALLWGL